MARVARKPAAATPCKRMGQTMELGEKMSTVEGAESWWREYANCRAYERRTARVRTVVVVASTKAGESAGNPPTRSGLSGVVPRRWVKMDLCKRGTSGRGEVNNMMVQR